jgi:hypothetical protein
MPSPSDKRLARYAVFSITHLAVVLIVLLGPFRSQDGALLVLLASVPLLWAWGHFHADVATNPALDHTGRTWWRVTFWCLPWAMTLYWLLHVRPRHAFD